MRKIVLAMSLIFHAANVCGQLSPGNLHRTHAHLEGLGNCTQCHEIGSKAFKDKCLACHEPLRQRVEAGLGLHARPGFETCQQCHVDHQGRDFELIHWPEGRQAFDHGLTGFALEGGHQSVACEACHRSENIANPQPLSQQGKQLERTFLGLEPTCLSCHEDEHRGQVSANCLSCHDMDGWGQVPGFDHDGAAFALAGKHADQACEACHPQEQDAKGLFSRFKPIAHDRCLNCHDDEHRGQVSPNCESCHDLNGWRPAPLFDHRRASFALTGAHQQVACEACHPQQPSAAGSYTKFKGLAAEQCSDCHEDVHEKRLGPTCESCHTTAGWDRMRAGSFDHDRTRFGLTGKHREVACDTCHLPGEPLAIAAFQDCTDCHQDTHLGQLDEWVQRDGCDACHSTAAFAPSLFSSQRHQDYFPLTGAHLAIPCIACHVEMTGYDPFEKVRRFIFEDTSCSGCHPDPHAGAVDTWTREASCRVCHEEASWQSMTFDHTGTRFPLTGGHAEATCRQCHGVGEGASAADLRFLATNPSCEACHSDPHQGQFAKKSGSDAGVSTDCAQCHDNRDWNPGRFDHQRTRFPLDGAHATAACEACHPREGTFRRFRPLDSRCEACHSSSKEER